MIIIAFSHKTSRILPRLLCRQWRHCAPVIQCGRNKFVMHQFVKYGRVEQIYLNRRAINRLKQHGWEFIQTDFTPNHNAKTTRALTCVIYTRRVANIYAPRVQTPDGLYKYLVKKTPTQRSTF